MKVISSDSVSFFPSKLCGTNGCCFKADIGNSYSDCGDYFFDGIQIGECDGFDIGEITAETLRKSKLKPVSLSRFGH